MGDNLMAGVSGVRGIVGEGLTPEILLRYASVFAGTLPPGPVVFGRDSRPSGPALSHAVLAGLLGSGRDVLEVGIVPTPTVQLEVERHRAAGGIALTASHNPIEWNALKFVGPSGRFLLPDEARSFLSKVNETLPTVRWDGLGVRHLVPDAVQHHVDLILELGAVDVEAVRRKRPRVVLDAVHGAGGAIGRMLLERLGCDFTILFEEPSGRFPRTPEPVAEHLDVLADAVRSQGADLGLAFDPDVDRLALVDENGVAVGEECTLALAADHMLDVKPGPVVTNLSTSARVNAVARRHGQEVIRTAVGEANVVAGILEADARVGGEGNGGVIIPDLHLGRDAPVAVALILTGLVHRGVGLSGWVDTLPDLAMIKIKLELRNEPDWDKAETALTEAVGGVQSDTTVDRRDGLKVSGEDEWVHLRKSGTEPIIRIIAEASNRDRAQILIESARRSLS